MNSFAAQLDLFLSRLGSPLRGVMGQALTARSNTPSGARDHILLAETPTAQRNSKLWVVDRILEPQTVIHFIEFTMRGRLPSGKQTALPLLSPKAVEFLQQPLSTWAPAPFDENRLNPMEAIMVSIGSFEDPSRLVSISKELHSMKSRIWEGVMPVSERRWNELQLDSPNQFSQACQYLCAVTNVFHYLNIPEIKKALRETYNIIWGHLETFDKALQAREKSTPQPAASAAALWHEFIKDHFSCISNRSHRWVIHHIERLRAPIQAQLSNDTLMESPGGFNGAQFQLSNKIHDLYENGAQADSAIFIPMDGYQGESTPAQDDVPVDISNPYREEPICFSANTLARKADYYCRIKYLSRIESYSGDDAGDNGTAATVRAQIRAQSRTRAELHGKAEPMEYELWVGYATCRMNEGSGLNWGYIGYRTCYDHSQEEWEEFKKKFEADISDWGSELQGVEAIKALCKVEWRDARELVTDACDIDIVKRHFQSSNREPAGHYCDDIFLVADKEVIDSYLEPGPRKGGHVLAIDVDYDPSDEDPNRVQESPGYEGRLRLLGSLLWDDAGPLLLLQTQHLGDLWPLAQDDPHKIYRGPLVPISR